MICRSSTKGFGLIEVLITLFVFSVGVLSIAGLQTISKRNNYDAVQRTTATQLANFIVSRMRANNTKLAEYVRDVGDEIGGGVLSQPGKICYVQDGNSLSATNECDATELAAYDLYQLEHEIDGNSEIVIGGGGEDDIKAGGIVSPSVCIIPPSGTSAGSSGVYRIVFAWKGIERRPDNTANDTACGLNRTSDLYEAESGSSYRRVLVLDSYIGAST